MPIPIVAKAPASTMLFGEHAVLRGGRAIVCAIDCPVYVSLEPLEQPEVVCTSMLGTMKSGLTHIDLGPKLRFVEACCSLYPWPSGAHITIESSINPTVGLGSSAAVTAGVLAVIHTWLFGSFDTRELLRDSKLCIQRVQQHGSGSDVAASIFGGTIAYHALSNAVEILPSMPAISLIYSGVKTPTPVVIQYVHDIERRCPRRVQSIMQAINEVTEEAVSAIKAQDWVVCGDCMNCAHGLMESLGVSTERLSHISWMLRAELLGAKISGSGLGDCVVGLGSTQLFHEHHIPSDIAQYGVHII